MPPSQQRAKKGDLKKVLSKQCNASLSQKLEQTFSSLSLLLSLGSLGCLLRLARLLCLGLRLAETRGAGQAGSTSNRVLFRQHPMSFITSMQEESRTLLRSERYLTVDLETLLARRRPPDVDLNLRCCCALLTACGELLVLRVLREMPSALSCWMVMT